MTITYSPCSCDRRLDGCLEDEDEAECAAESSNLVLVLALVPAILLTIAAIELIYCYMVQEEDTGRWDTGELTVQNREELLHEEQDTEAGGEDVVMNIREFMSLILDIDNWDLGFRDDSSLLRPSYHEGGFDASKMPALRRHYHQVRTRGTAAALRYITFSLQQDSRHGERSAALAHYTHCLLYNVLEREFVTSRGHTGIHDLDISIKDALTTRHAAAFYDTVYPYFDPIGMVKTKLMTQPCVLKILGCFMLVASKIPAWLKYFASLTLCLVSYYVDFIKDILIAYDLSFLLTCFLCNFHSVVVVTQWVTVFLSHFIIGTRVLVSVIRNPHTVFGERARKRVQTHPKLQYYRF